MTGDEAEQLYRVVSDTLRAAGLDWVIDQVESAVQAGRLQTVAVHTARGEQSSEVIAREPLKPSPGRRNRYLQTVPLTPHERLSQLLLAVEHVGIELPGIANAAVTELVKTNELTGVLLADDADIRRELPIIERADDIGRLRELLREI